MNALSTLRFDRRDMDADWDHAFADIVADLEPHQTGTPTPPHDYRTPLRCVSGGYLDDGCSCSATVPLGVVSAAWGRELTRCADKGDRFFRLAWEGEVWLAYGLDDGSVRGVYCPSHSAERDERASAAILAPAPSRSLPLGA